MAKRQISLKGNGRLKLVLQTKTRYRAFLHMIELQPYGKVLVPLDKIDPRFEFLEEIRFQSMGTNASHTGLVEFITETAPIIYKTNDISWMDRTLAYELRNEFGLTLPLNTTHGPRRKLPEGFMWYNEYFPSYEVKGIQDQSTFVTFFSPYEDEIETPDNIMYELFYNPGDPRTRIKIELISG